uniref:C-type lectin domain-containing protein n=1 Tax=Sphaeramia orbicularis TaxID=375764 RepID=A0A672YLW8_9TELE
YTTTTTTTILLLLEINHIVFCSPPVIKTLLKTCPEGWKLLSSSCYFSSTAVGTWETARSDCRKKSADLVIINTKEEQDFISALNKQYWIGLSDREQEGTWTWIYLYSCIPRFWHTGEPNNSGGEDCGENRDLRPIHEA